MCHAKDANPARAWQPSFGILRFGHAWRQLGRGPPCHTMSASASPDRPRFAVVWLRGRGQRHEPRPIEALWERENFKKALQRYAPLDIAELDQAGVRTADLSRVLVARTPGNGSTCAIRFKTAPDRSKYLGQDLPGRTYAAFTSLTGPYK